MAVGGLIDGEDAAEVRVSAGASTAGSPSSNQIHWASSAPGCSALVTGFGSGFGSAALASRGARAQR